MSPKRPKKTYATFAVEQHIDASRIRTWAALLDVDSLSALDGVTVLSIEPPWRRVVGIGNTPLSFYEETTTIRDDLDTCHLTISAVIEPLPNRASDGLIKRLEAQAKSRTVAISAWSTR